MEIRRVGETIRLKGEKQLREVLRADMPDLAAIEQFIPGVIADPRIELEYEEPQRRPEVPTDKGQRSREAQRIKSRLENAVAVAFRDLGPFRSIRSTTGFFGYKFDWFDVEHPEFRALVKLVGNYPGTLTVLVGNGEARSYQILPVEEEMA